MRDFGSLWLCEDASDRDTVPGPAGSIPVADCHEWDGLFSIQAAAADLRVLLTAWCDGRDTGAFTIEQDGVEIASGHTRVVHAPELVEPDGYKFPPGSHFGRGLWSIVCKSTGAPDRLIKVLVRDWNSTE